MVNLESYFVGGQSVVWARAAWAASLQPSAAASSPGLASPQPVQELELQPEPAAAPLPPLDSPPPWLPLPAELKGVRTCAARLIRRQTRSQLCPRRRA